MRLNYKEDGSDADEFENVVDGDKVWINLLLKNC
jgi:hypothetical protein